MAKRTSSPKTTSPIEEKNTAPETTATPDVPSEQAAPATQSPPALKRSGNLAFLQPADRKVIVRHRQKGQLVERSVKARDYELPEGTENYIHVVPRETQVPQENPYVLPEPKEEGVLMINPRLFFQRAAQQLNEREAFRVQDNRDVFRVLHNLDEALIEDRFFFLLPDPRQGRGSTRKKVIAQLLEKKRTVVYGTKLIRPEDILHLPELREEKNIESFIGQLPSEVMPE
jgi:hypothetical protein